MNKMGKISFEDVGIARLLEQHQLRVPLHQREFSWTKEQVNDLYRDVADTIADRKPNYFLGTIVIALPEEDLPQIVDGQQRIVTTTILIAAIRDFMFRQNYNDSAISLENDFLTKYDRIALEHVPNLRLNTDDDQYFRNSIIARSDSPERNSATATKPSHFLLKEAAKLAEERVQLIVEGHSDSQARLHEWIKYLQETVVVIVIWASKEMDAYKMFETLNDRGLPTTQADMLKSYLLQQATEGSLLEAQSRWSSMRTSIDPLGLNDGVVDYLRHFTLAKLGPTKEKSSGFYSRLQQDVQGKTKSLRFLNDLAIYADNYAALLSPSHSKWNDYDDRVRLSLEAIKLFGVAQIRPLMLAVVQHFVPEEADKAFRSFLCWTVRFLIVGGTRTQALQDAYAQQAYNVTTGKAKTAKDIRANLIGSVIPNNEVFEAGFGVASVSNSQLARYYLRALEATKSTETEAPELLPIEDKKIVNLEHIMPQTLGNGWTHIASETAAAYTNRIGNLVLMNAKQNKLIGNSQFSAKRKLFDNSSIKLTKMVAEDTNDDTLWGPSEIESRQKVLAKLAVKTWGL
jgi:uncharacterized protein with ParB-like and HNH nuclease domain